MQLFSPLSDVLFEPRSEFEREVLDFCVQWKSGKSSFLFHTSGSTGMPKPIWLDRKAMEVSALCTGNWLQLKPHDVALACLPVQYIAGAMVVVRALVLNLQLCLVEPSGNPLLDLSPVSLHMASFVPNQWHAILNSKIDLTNFFQNVKGILLGGSALSEKIVMASMDFQWPIFETYGMTETVSHVAFRPIGSAYFQTLDGIETGVDDRGCLLIKGAVTEFDWVQTNDIVKALSPNTFEIIGRLDRVINSAGRKVHPEKLEEFISKQDLQPSAFFIDSLPHEVYGQQVALFYQGAWDKKAEVALTKILRSTFESWELPKQFIHLSDFQFTSSGKIDRLKSVDLYLKSKK
ncbi:AMP-binding protein [Aquirufa sp.]|jgi:O-succinylbenzoic acid--CoA ligase|uniref:AMP-binding protein n=1 Tax=Aquirufa sp. TaxID=2676249 RepID=UPI0037BF0F29